MKRLSALLGISLVVIVAAVYAQSPVEPPAKVGNDGANPPDAPPGATGSDRPDAPRRFRYTAEIHCREFAAGTSHDLGAFSLPIVGHNEPATVKMTSGKLDISAECTVKPFQDIDIATLTLRVARDGLPVTCPRVQVVIGQSATVQVGDNDRNVHMEVVVYGR
jgi:hypothetical protein